MLTFVAMQYKYKLKKYNISIDELAIMFGSKSSISFRNSSAYKRYLNATLQIINKVESEIKNKL